MTYVEYDSNNSGGSWWLTDKNWFALEQAGWIIEWKHLGHKYVEGEYVRGDNGIPVLVPYHESDEFRPNYGDTKREVGHRWLNALATGAYRPNLTLREAATEWENVTGLSSTEAGCPCCGQPHRFTEYTREGKYVASGPDVNYSANWS